MSALDLWRAYPTKPIGDFGLGIVKVDGQLHWESGEALSEYDLRFVAEEDFAAPADPRTSREYLLEMALWGVASPMRHIRLKCHECMGGDRGGPLTSRTSKDVEACSAVACPLWPFRLGFDPRREPMSEEQRAVVRERFHGSREASERINSSKDESLQDRPEALDPVDHPSDEPDAL